MLMLQTHYRSPLVFGDQRLSEADAALTRIENAVKNVDWQLANAADGDATVDAAALAAAVEKAREDFITAMDDDFNAPAAAGCVFGLVNELNAAVAGKTLTTADVAAVQAARDCVVDLMGTFGIDVVKADDDPCASYPDGVLTLAAEVAGYEGTDKGAAVEALLNARAEARKAKNWAVADAVRDGLKELGATVEDTPQGPRVTF